MSVSNDLQGSLYWAQLLATVATIGGSTWMIYSCYKAPRPRNDIVILVGAIGVSDLIYAFPNALSLYPHGTPFLCSLEGFTRELFLVSLFFVTSTAILCFRQAKERSQEGQEGLPTNQRGFVIKAIIISLLLAIFIASLPFIFPMWFAYDETNVHCWVTAPPSSQDKESLMILAVFVFEIIPIFIGAVFTFYFYYRAVKIANDSVGSFVSRQFNSYHLFWYPFVLFVVFVFSIIDDLRTAQGKQGYQAFELLHILLTHSIGFINAILYGFQKKGIFARNQVVLLQAA